MMKSPVIPLLSNIFQEVTTKVRGRHQLWKNMGFCAQWLTLFLSLRYPPIALCHCSPVKCQTLLARGLLPLAIFKAASIKGNKSITDLNFLPFHAWNLRWNRWKLYLSFEGTTRLTILWRQTEDICSGFAISLIPYPSKKSTMKSCFHKRELEFNFSRAKILSLTSQTRPHC